MDTDEKAVSQPKMVRYAEEYCRLGFNALPLKDPRKTQSKQPSIQWRHGQVDYTRNPFTFEDIHEAARDREYFKEENKYGERNYTHGIITITGINNLRALDIDHIKNFDVIAEILHIMGLSEDYPWAIISGSEQGGLIWVINEEDDEALTQAGFPANTSKVETRYDQEALDLSWFDHLELRWNGNCCVLPPSLHPSGNRYRFRSINHIPSTAPSRVSIDKIKAVFDALCKPFEAKKKGRASKGGSNKERSSQGSDTWFDAFAHTWLRIIDETENGYIIECPWADQHTTGTVGSTRIWRTESGGTFNCFHSHCQDRTWDDILRLYPPYAVSSSGFLWNAGKHGIVKLCNFTASIQHDIITDDGAETRRIYGITTYLNGRTRTFEVSAGSFAALNWVDEYLGSQATIAPGQNIKPHLANAIKAVSTAQEETHYTHTGWRRIEGQMVYLHAGGILSQVSQVCRNPKLGTCDSLGRLVESSDSSSVTSVTSINNIYRVQLSGALSKYELPLVPQGENLLYAIRASLAFQNLAPDDVTCPLLASIYRSPLGDIDYGVHLAGASGKGKTALAALAQQHYGAAMDTRGLPGSWESTENSLEMLMFQAKDAALVIDDFKPRGGKHEQDKLHVRADRVFRSLANNAARGRLTATLEQRPERPPQCLVISTGEDVPRGQSLKARMVLLTMSKDITRPGSEESKRLDYAQRQHAATGVYAQSMAAYIAWLSPQIDRLQKQLPELIAQERNTLVLEGHARTTTNMANMVIGMDTFLRFALEAGAITQDQRDDYMARCKKALTQVAEEAAQENRLNRPSLQWLRLVGAAISQRRAHLAAPKGGICPGLAYGWKRTTRWVNRDGGLQDEYIDAPCGDLIGWIEGDDVYLLPTAAYKAAKSLGVAIGDEMTTTESTLRKFLLEDGILASTGLNNRTRTICIQKRLDGLPQYVLHLARSTLFQSDTPPDPPPDADKDTDHYISQRPVTSPPN